MPANSRNGRRNSISDIHSMMQSFRLEDCEENSNFKNVKNADSLFVPIRSVIDQFKLPAWLQRVNSTFYRGESCCSCRGITNSTFEVYLN